MERKNDEATQPNKDLQKANVKEEVNLKEQKYKYSDEN